MRCGNKFVTDGQGLAMWRYFKNRQPVTAAEFIIKSSLFIQMLGVIRRLELKPNSEQKVENIFVARLIAKRPVISHF
jgi:hypothetical protein